MTSPVDIANLALASVGTRSTILSFTEVSTEATAISQWYDLVRRQTLRAALWGFARQFIDLALIKSAPGTQENPNPPPQAAWSSAFPPPPWLFEYAYPANCLMARYVVPAATQQLSGVPIFSTNNPVAWSVMGPSVKSIVIIDQDPQGNDIKAICTNQDQATLCYTKDVLNVDLWDPGFQQAVVDGLGYRITIGLTGDKKLSDMLAQRANDTIMRARASNANESLSNQGSIPDWIRTRGVNYGWDGYTQTLESFGPLFPNPI
jgi:hypothetical protein